MSVAGTKPVEALALGDLEAHPVWRFVNSDSQGEVAVRPVQRFPLTNLANHLVAVQLGLSSGAKIWGLLGNIDLASADMTCHFLSVSVLHQGHWFHLARYHDPMRAEHGPEALAAFIGLTVSQVFPLAYDISRWCVGLPNVVRGAVPAEPAIRLSRAELIALAVP